MRVMDLTGTGQPPIVEIETGSAFELLVSLYAYGSTEEWDVYEVGRSWFEDIQAAATAELSAALGAIGGLSKLWIHLMELGLESAPPRDVPAFLGFLEAAPPP